MWLCKKMWKLWRETMSMEWSIRPPQYRNIIVIARKHCIFFPLFRDIFVKYKWSNRFNKNSQLAGVFLQVFFNIETVRRSWWYNTLTLHERLIQLNPCGNKTCWNLTYHLSHKKLNDTLLQVFGLDATRVISLLSCSWK